jgi:hypothetical protein
MLNDHEQHDIFDHAPAPKPGYTPVPSRPPVAQRPKPRPAPSPKFTDAEIGLACLAHLTRAAFVRMQAQSHGSGDLVQLLDLQRACIRAYADLHGIPQARLDAALAGVAGGAFAKPNDKAWHS